MFAAFARLPPRSRRLSPRSVGLRATFTTRLWTRYFSRNNRLFTTLSGLDSTRTRRLRAWLLKTIGSTPISERRRAYLTTLLLFSSLYFRQPVGRLFPIF